jgi:hypothetical protein
MSNTLEISLSTHFTSQPASCKIYFCEELIFDGLIEKERTFIHVFEGVKLFKLKIIKNGKFLNLVRNHQEQIVYVKTLKLNGIDLKIKEFGKFKTKENPYVSDQILQTDTLALNGEWIFELLSQPLVGSIDINNIKIRNKIEDCDVACFGCSNTYGSFLEKNESWPYHLGKMLDCKVNNYGIGGSNLNQITAFVEYYIKNFNTKLIVLLMPHSIRRQFKEDNKIINIGVDDIENKNFIMHGEEHSVANLSMSLGGWLKNIKTNIYFGSYNLSEYNLMSKTPLKEYMLPFLDHNLHPKASDNLHFGPEYCKNYAELIANFIKDTRSSITL